MVCMVISQQAGVGQASRYLMLGTCGSSQLRGMRSVFSTYDRPSVMRPSQKKWLHKRNLKYGFTNKLGHRFDNIVDPTDQILVSWYHRHCFDNQYQPCRGKDRPTKFDYFLPYKNSLILHAYHYMQNYDAKSIPAPLKSCINEIYAKFWSINIQQGITNDGLLHSGFQHQLVVLHHFVW